MRSKTLLFLGICIILAGLYLGLGGQALLNPPQHSHRVEYRQQYSSGGQEKRQNGYHGPDYQPGTFPASPPDQSRLQVLTNIAYTVAYNNQLKNPAWVKYILDWSTHSDEHMKRPKIPFYENTPYKWKLCPARKSVV